MGSGSSDRPRRPRPNLIAARPAQHRESGDPALAASDTEAGRYPRIPPWRRPISRTTGEIQFGVSAGGPIVTGVSEAEARVLARLDGTVPLGTSYRFAGEVGIPARRWRALLDLIEEIGVLERFSPEEPCRTVLLDGRGVLLEELCQVLRRGGIDALVSAAGRSGAPDAKPTADPPLVVVLGAMALDPRSGDPWLRSGIPHLPVVVEGPRATVGPLVEPTLQGPCLWCLDLHRTDRDASWPVVLAQVCGSPSDVVHRDAAPETDPALVQLVAGCIALFARRLPGSTSLPVGVAVELSLPWPRMDHRKWTIHPRCPRPHAARATEVP
ncbi:MAG TPA: hypothetical protein VIR15_00100 [Intrasporangium sp.]|jgi:hypothetical protein|uniref:hypothetical protein n=1 Tax=Intrasporangium sp. TaxID=1925024 RepID=UPI002F939FB7